MELRAVIKRATGPAPSIAFAILLLGAVLLLTAAAQHSEILSDHFSILVVVNLFGILILALLIAANLWRLVRQFRSGILGSRFTIRLLIAFALLAILPLSVVYYFSVQFLNKGIDSWFDVRIEQALDDALLLGRSSLEAFKNDQLRQT
ncbi:MAG: two-component sensor histidine kinase, partial [Gammaproteobacteria bacterium]|nr:two-component sensor histidine kinase [Gammaproteobacteria bacterium]